MPRKNPHEGSTFESFLEEEGILEETRERAIEAVRAWQRSRAMQAPRKITPHPAAVAADLSRKGRG